MQMSPPAIAETCDTFHRKGTLTNEAYMVTETMLAVRTLTTISAIMLITMILEHAMTAVIVTGMIAIPKPT